MLKQRSANTALPAASLLKEITTFLEVPITGCGFAAIAKSMKRFRKLSVYEHVPQEKNVINYSFISSSAKSYRYPIHCIM